jgi:uncharacterized membrane protein YedE/YeeE
MTVPKTILFTIGLGAVFIALETGTGIAHYHIKPFVVTGIILGGLIFGIGMAILGYCPGTLAISVGEGSTDAVIGVTGGLTGGVVYTLLLPYLNNYLGPDLGKISLHSLFEKQNFWFYFTIMLLGVIFIFSSFLLDRYDTKNGKTNRKWIITGIGLAVLNGIIFLTSVSDRPIGASTTYPYLADKITGLTDNSYFLKIEKPGHWEMIFLTGSLFSGFLFSIIRKEFKFGLIYNNKEKRNSKFKRIVWSFISGFILIFGARMAGGCTSGHIISGSMQMAFSSIVFAAFVGIGFVFTGLLFYKKHD